MKRIFLFSLFLLISLNANKIQNDLITVSTKAEYNRCSICINGKIIYQRACEFEYNPNLIFYVRLQNYNDVWVFQDNPMGNACDGGILRIFERKNGEAEIAYRGEIDWCGGTNPTFQTKRNIIKIIDENLKKEFYFEQSMIK